MKVAIVQNVGINDHRMVHTDGLGRELSNRGYDVDVIIQKSEGKYQSGIPPYKVIELPGDIYSFSGQLKFIWELLHVLKKQKYDIIHGKNPFSSVFPAIILKKMGGMAKIIYDIRGLWIDFGVHAEYIPQIITPLLNKLDVFCMRQADKIIAISYELRDILVRGGVKKRKIEVIVGDGVDLSKAKSIKKKDVGGFFGLNGRVIGYVGSIGRTRVSERIIESFEIVKKQADFEVNLVMVGPFPNEVETRYFRNLVRKKGLEGSVFFTGLVASHDEVLQFIKSFDVALSYHEKSLPCFDVMVPTKILEYLAAGRSIVATDHQSHKNLLTHGKDAYLTEQNPKAFAEGVICLLKNDELSKSLSKNAQITAEKYSFKKVTNKVEQIYESLLSQTSGRT